MIRIENVDFRYGRKQPQVLYDFSLDLQGNAIYGLLGKNGTGKSTLLYLISGLLRPQAGSVSIDGRSAARRDADVLADIFLVPEEFDLPNVPIRQYVATNAPFYPNFSQSLLDECLRGFDLPTDVHLGSLSMGQKKKAFMSFALATQTRILLMDEPTNGLDIPSKSQFRRVVARGMSEDRTFVISTHQVRDVEALVDHVVMLDGTRLLLASSVEDICGAIRIEHRPAGQPVDDALYAVQTIGGSTVICPNDGRADTQLDLETLFGALLEHPRLLDDARLSSSDSADQ